LLGQFFVTSGISQVIRFDSPYLKQSQLQHWRYMIRGFSLQLVSYIYNKIFIITYIYSYASLKM